jgi:integrase
MHRIESDDDEVPIWLLALVTRLRKGELLGLRWQDISFEEKVLQVRQTVGALHGKIEFKGTKRPKSKRTIDLDDPILAVLRAHKHRQNERRLQMRPHWVDHDLVFPSSVGTPVNPDNCDLDFNRLTRFAGVKKIRIHDTRHSYATLAILRGMPINVVSESMGHADISTTLRTYAHVMPEQRRELARTMSALLLPLSAEEVG